MSSDKKTFYLFLLLGIALLVLRLPTFFELPSTDQTITAYVGQQMREGQLLYRDLWTHRTPGSFFFYAGIAYLAGTPPWIIPLADILYTLLTMGALFLLARSFWGSKAALGSVFVFALFSLSPLSSAARLRTQPEMLINLPLVLAIYTGYRAFQHQKIKLWFFSGLLFGLAFIVKFTALFFVLPLIPFFWHSPPGDAPVKNLKIKNFSGFFLGFLIPAAATVVYLYIKGILFEAYEALVVFNRLYVQVGLEMRSIYYTFWQQLEGQLVFLSAVLLLALIGCGRGKLYRSLIGLTMMLWILGGLLSLMMQGKYFQHYFLFLVPPLSLLAGYGGELIMKKVENKKALILFIIIFILSLIAMVDAARAYLGSYGAGFRYVFQKADYEQAVRALPVNAEKVGLWELSKFIARNSQAKDYIYIWSGAAEIYYYTHRRSPNRFLFTPFLMNAQNRFGRAFPGIEERRQEFLSNLQEKPVKFFMVGRGDISAFEPVKDSMEQLKDFPELDRYLQTHYSLLIDNERYLLFERK